MLKKEEAGTQSLEGTGLRDAAKLRFLSDNAFPSQRTAGVIGPRAEVERLLTFFFWKTCEDIAHKGQGDSGGLRRGRRRGLNGQHARTQFLNKFLSSLSSQLYCEVRK